MEINHLIEMQKQLMEKKQELDQLMEKYQSACKALFGIADGEALNILQIVALINKVTGR